MNEDSGFGASLYATNEALKVLKDDSDAAVEELPNLEEEVRTQERNLVKI